MGRFTSWRTCFQPKNDHILFAFSACRWRPGGSGRLRSFTVLAKNKLMRVLGDRPVQRVLVRDLDDILSLRGRLPDFDKNPRWKEYKAHSSDPCGLVVTEARGLRLPRPRRRRMGQHGSWWTKTCPSETSRRNSNKRNASRSRASGNCYPGARRAILVRRALLRFDAIAYIDDKGDSVFDMPHLYVPYEAKHGPFAGFRIPEINEHTQVPLEG